MQLPAPLLCLVAAACLVVTYRSISASGTSVPWWGAFAAVLTYLARLPRALRFKNAAREGPRQRSRALSIGAVALFFLCGCYALATLGAVRFTLACACTAGVYPIPRSRHSARIYKVICTVAACVLLVVTSDPGQTTPPSALFGAAGVLCAIAAVHISTTDVLRDAEHPAFLFAAAILGLIGFIATLLQSKVAAENEVVLLVTFCIAALVLACCAGAGISLQARPAPLIASLLAIAATGRVCGVSVFPAAWGKEPLVWIVCTGLIVVAHRGLAFTDATLSSAAGSAFDPAQMFKKTRQHREDGGVLASLLSNSRERKLFIFLLLTVAIMFLEFIYGVAVNSLGLISDSFHMMLDGTSIAIGLYAAHASSWRPDEKTHPFGYARFEVFGGFVNGILLLFIALYVTVESIQRILDPPEIEGPYLLLVSVIGLAVNIVGVVFFHDSHGHSHSHSHGEGGGGHVDHNMRGVYLHILADLLGSVSVIISSVLIYLFGLWVADPICSAISAVLILLSAFPLLEETGKVLLLSAPEHGKNYSDELRGAILETALLQDVETPRIWTHATPPRELTICAVAGKMRGNVDYNSARTRIIDVVTAHMLRHLDAHSVSVVVHLE